MSTEAEELTTVVAELVKSRKYQRGAWQKVIDEARKYAQMKAHGTYIERGNVMHCCPGDLEPYTKRFRDNLLQAVESAYIEDAIMGAALADQT